MKEVIAIGEALIDFIPEQTECRLKEVASFEKRCGGAPANVCCAVGKLGGRARMITKLGKDPFGDYIVDELQNCHVDVSSVLRTEQANTALAFVSLQKDGNRDFSFYRKPSADMLLSEAEIREEWFQEAGILHFCSVDLIDAPVREAHKRAIALAKKQGAIISFDPNIRLMLWEDAQQCKETVLEFLPLADIVKISDEEIEFILGTTDVDKAAEQLLKTASMLLYSMGKDGAVLYRKNGKIQVPGEKVKAIDTTGAGDAVIGSFLYKIQEVCTDYRELDKIPDELCKKAIQFANRYAALSVQRKGAAASYPTREQMEQQKG